MAKPLHCVAHNSHHAQIQRMANATFDTWASSRHLCTHSQSLPCAESMRNHCHSRSPNQGYNHPPDCAERRTQDSSQHVRQDKLEVFQASTGSHGGVCSVCLGHHNHTFAKCNSTKLWNRSPWKNEQGRMVAVDSLPICFNWQVPKGCQSTSHSNHHKCSGCGKSNHGAQTYPHAERAWTPYPLQQWSMGGAAFKLRFVGEIPFPCTGLHGGFWPQNTSNSGHLCTTQSSFLMYIVTLSITSFHPASILAHSCTANWNGSLVHFSPPHCPWFPKCWSQASTMLFMISPTHTTIPLASCPSILTLIVTTSPAPGGRLQLLPSSLPDYHQDHKLQYAMRQKHTEQSLPCQPNGWGLLSISKPRISSWSIHVTTLVSPQQEEYMGWLQMLGLISFGNKAWAHSWNGWMITFVSEYPMFTYPHTMYSVWSGPKKYEHTEASGRRAVRFDTGERSCPMTSLRSSVRTAAWGFMTWQLAVPPLTQKWIATSPTQMPVLMSSQWPLASNGSPQDQSHLVRKPLLGLPVEPVIEGCAPAWWEKARYLTVITKWREKRTHNLLETQRLYGKLLHATLVIPAGHAHLTSLEVMLASLNNSPFCPHTPPQSTLDDLDWWQRQLSQVVVSIPIPRPWTLTDHRAYSDASSGFSIAVMIGPTWRTWQLVAGWKSQGRDIQWAEAIGFKLLAIGVCAFSGKGEHILLYGDNQGIVEGWWKRWSTNKPTNHVFQWILQL